jgi:hypothetical protein
MRRASRLALLAGLVGAAPGRALAPACGPAAVRPAIVDTSRGAVRPVTAPVLAREPLRIPDSSDGVAALGVWSADPDLLMSGSFPRSHAGGHEEAP